MAKVTREQAQAFIEALTGSEAVGVAQDEPVSRFLSPAARTHLEAVLGLGQVPNSYWDVRQFLKWQDKTERVYSMDAVARVTGLLNYLAGVVAALRQETAECAHTRFTVAPGGATVCIDCGEEVAVK